MPSINSLTPQHAVSSYYCPTTTPTRARAKYHTVEINKYINSKCVNKVSCCVVSRLFPEDAAAKKKIPQILTLSLQDKDPVFGLTGTYRLAIYFLNKHKLIFILVNLYILHLQNNNSTEQFRLLHLLHLSLLVFYFIL